MKVRCDLGGLPPYLRGSLLLRFGTDHSRLAAAVPFGGGKPRTLFSLSERQAFPQIERQAAKKYNYA